MNSFSKASEAQGWMFRDSLVPPFLRKWLRDKFERPGEMGKLSFQSLGYFFSTRQKNKTTSSPLQENRKPIQNKLQDASIQDRFDKTIKPRPKPKKKKPDNSRNSQRNLTPLGPLLQRPFHRPPHRLSHGQHRLVA